MHPQLHTLKVCNLCQLKSLEGLDRVRHLVISACPQLTTLKGIVDRNANGRVLLDRISVHCCQRLCDIR